MADKPLTVAVLSGKGGTGKTLVSVNLAAAAGEAVYLDCDVEEPNGHLFFKPEKPGEETVAVKIPQIDTDLCTGCRKCVEFCAFHALAFADNHPMLFILSFILNSLQEIFLETITGNFLLMIKMENSVDDNAVELFIVVGLELIGIAFYRIQAYEYVAGNSLAFSIIECDYVCIVIMPKVLVVYLQNFIVGAKYKGNISDLFFIGSCY